MLRNRYFLFLWFVNIATTLAIELFTVTILVSIYEQTESTLLAAGTMVARTLPTFLLGPVAGVLVDRFSRKKMLISMDLLRLMLVGVAIWFLQGDGNVPVVGIYLILAGLSAADVFHRPARMALIHALVSHQQLVKANSFILASTQIVMALSYMVGGWLILALPLRQIALGVVIIFALSALAAMLIVEPKDV
ncbi:MAG: MFS transporter, partial [Desulfuromusa sp.]|nr:MFS transporter [Desulfuromusa sp.]